MVCGSSTTNHNHRTQALAAADLPDDIEALKRLVLAHQEELASRAREIESLQMLIAKLKRMKFGRSSERLDREIEQLELQLDELEAQISKVDESAAVVVPARSERPPARVAGAPATRKHRARTGVPLPALRW